jgi:hypothetical protein
VKCQGRSLVAAAAVAVLLAVLAGCGTDASPGSGSDSGQPVTERAEAFELEPPMESNYTFCPRDSDRALRRQALALGGTVTAKDDLEVRVSVDRWYRWREHGEGPADVVVRGNDVSIGFFVGEYRLEPGVRVLLSAGDDRLVDPCGLSGAYSPALARRYEEAFGDESPAG